MILSLSLYRVVTLFSNTLRVGLLTLLSIWCAVTDAQADCKPGVFHLGAITSMPINTLASTLHDKTGCNFIFHPSLSDKSISLPEADYQPVTLTNQLGKQFGAEVSLARTVLIIAPKKITLKGTGKLVSLNLVDAPVKSVNQILKKLGSKNLITQSEDKKITTSLYDVPLDDLSIILEMLIEG
jgi:hypothetical protein